MTTHVSYELTISHLVQSPHTRYHHGRRDEQSPSRSTKTPSLCGGKLDREKTTVAGACVPACSPCTSWTVEICRLSSSSISRSIRCPTLSFHYQHKTCSNTSSSSRWRSIWSSKSSSSNTEHSFSWKSTTSLHSLVSCSCCKRYKFCNEHEHSFGTVEQLICNGSK